MTPEQLRQRAAEATPGPWAWSPPPGEVGPAVVLLKEAQHETYFKDYTFTSSHSTGQARIDAALIALAPELALLLADAMEALEAVGDWVRDGEGSEADAAEKLDAALHAFSSLGEP